MFQFGFFSTHIPYIITVVAYLLSYGLYALNRSDAEPTEPSTTASISSSHEIRVEKAAAHQTYDATSHFQAQQSITRPDLKNPVLFARTIPVKGYCPPNIRTLSSFRTYALFSRPPTFC